ncbi:hypothetical protein OIU84_010586 [Salix udensis]|uniref:DNA mismatch repair protein MSH7 n=1 Tax=Salix udensis TaxID=889485 RepID=A0AAD6JL25_9ROSI|nr:hypothetical protein OIU84_010586 [Salix udensis]
MYFNKNLTSLKVDSCRSTKMQRQKSILSFFQKPSLPSQSPDAGEKNDGRQAPLFSAKQNNQNVFQPAIHGLVDTSLEIRGTDTPPEKVPCQILPVNIKENEGGKGATLFSSIMHKFIKFDDREKPNGRNQVHSANACSTSGTFTIPKELPTQGMDMLYSEKDNGIISNGMVDQTSVLNIESVDDVPGPHTPGMRLLVPRLKRIPEDVPKFEDKNGCSFLNSNKRAKPLQDSASLIKNHEEISNSISKFEWLDPARIRDANGRRPNDPLYDKKTLYLPPDAFKKMSASQKQYWTVKSQYMDVLLFFKVGKFYELYELDAEIGHKELDWKMTLSGVGKCRQVGISESGIDDAVEKLVACGYKVGRVEQLETSDQAKSRGANSVIQRKLVQVVTPSTITDRNMGPDAVYLLAIKEGNYGVDNGATAYGFAFADCAALRVWVGSINDDASHAALGALLMQISPKEVIYENRELSRSAQKELMKYSLIGSTALQLSPVLPGTDFVDASEVRNLIQSKDYFKRSTNPWNCALDSIMHRDLSLCALGGLIGHLSRLMFDDILRNADILPYQVYKGCLRMDGQTLVNLEIFSNSANGGSSGTLFNYLDNCMTSSGKRLLRNWICHPLKHAEGINNRLDVIENLMARSEIMLVTAQYLRKLPDLERMLGRIKVSFQASGSLALPLISKKLLKQQNHDVTDSEAGMLSVLIELFIEKATQWGEVIHAINCIDVLRSFAVTASMSCGAMCRPDILPDSKSISFCEGKGGPVLKIKGLWHPFALGESGLPVPNDVFLGEDSDSQHPLTVLLTGPNMGGKSTLLRATCLAVILAQLGCFVPSEKCVLSLADMIFTRLGATDRIMTGESKL